MLSLTLKLGILSVVMLRGVIPSVVMLSVVLPSVVMLSEVMLTDVTPSLYLFNGEALNELRSCL